MFVAGVFALMGFYGAYWLPYYIFTRDTLQILSHLLIALALPLGIGVLLGSARALLFTQIYLWAEIILGFIAIPVICFIYPSEAVYMIWRSGPSILICLMLLGLLIWSRSKRFNNEPDV
jgi:hypothetical protein